MYEIHTLKNGLKIIFENIDYVNSISVGIWTKNGSRNETKEINGISHFIEHILFKGTNRRSAKELVEEIESVGGEINAFTGKEATCFYIKALNNHLELSLDILSDILLNSNFNNEDIEKEKSVVIEEICSSQDSPEDIITDLHSEASYINDGISMTILGTKENILSFDRGILIDYINNNYSPNNSVISICGNFSNEKALYYIEKYFGDWKSSNKNIHYSNPEISKLFLSKEKSIEQAHLSLGIPGIAIGDEDLYSVYSLCNILGGGASSILFQEIREQLGLCYTIFAYNSPHINTGLINIYAALNIKSLDVALKSIYSIINNFKEINLNSTQLYKAKEQLKGNYILGLESTSNRMFGNGKNLLFLNKIKEPKEIIKAIDNIKTEDLNRVIDKTFKQGIVNGALLAKDINEVYLNNIISTYK